ncbi:MAG: hypothetical protein NTV49_13620 [Kiritimatiellaeota bacterium]|nr:hypothetical protein [Kiritimatiellota bacterium]
MKRWAVITVALYLLILLSVTFPLLQAGFAWGKNPLTTAATLATMRSWGYWVWIGVAVLGQISLLAVPVAVGERRPRSRRQLREPVIMASFLMAMVCVSAVTALACGIWGDHITLFDIFGKEGAQPLWALLLYVTVAWTVWGLVFHRFLKETDPAAMVRRLMKWLLRGSILELLVAVPSHIIVRQRNDCCAPLGTFWGIATGVTVMLLAFGPGVFFLFAERLQRLQPRGGEDKNMTAEPLDPTRAG